MEKISLFKSREYLIYSIVPFLFLGKTYKVVAGMVVILFLIEVFKQKKWNIFNDTIFKTLALWCVYLFISALWAVKPTSSMSGSLELLLFTTFYLAVKNTLTTKKQIKNFLFINSGMVLFVVLNIFIQYVTGYNLFGIPIHGLRTTELISDGLSYGQILPIWIALFGAMVSGFKIEKKQYVLFSIALFTTIIAIPLTGTRGPLIIMAIFIPLIAWLSPYRKYAMMALTVLLASLVLVVSTSPKLQARLATLKSPFENQKYVRIPIWLTAFEMFKDNPIAGVGFKNFRYRALEYYDEDLHARTFNIEKKKVPFHTHSPWADIASEQGLIGLSFAGFLLFSVLRLIIAFGPIAAVGSMGIWYTFSLLNSTFALSSGKWSFFSILSITFFAIILNNLKKEKA